MLVLHETRAAALAASNEMEEATRQLPDYLHSRFLQLYPAFFELLPGNERRMFVEDPVGFTSERYFFRGMSIPKMQELLRERRMIPESGDYNGTAVFVTDSPVAAAQFMANESALVVLDPKKAEYLEPQGPHDTTSESFRALEREFIMTFPFQERFLAAYTCVNHWDTIGPFAQGRTWHTICLRKEQPMEAVRFVVMLHESAEGEPIVYELPSNPQDLQLLKRVFGIL